MGHGRRRRAGPVLCHRVGCVAVAPCGPLGARLGRTMELCLAARDLRDLVVPVPALVGRSSPFDRRSADRGDRGDRGCGGDRPAPLAPPAVAATCPQARRGGRVARRAGQGSPGPDYRMGFGRRRRRGVQHPHAGLGRPGHLCAQGQTALRPADHHGRVLQGDAVELLPPTLSAPGSVHGGPHLDVGRPAGRLGHHAAVSPLHRSPRGRRVRLCADPGGSLGGSGGRGRRRPRPPIRLRGLHRLRRRPAGCLSCRPDRRRRLDVALTGPVQTRVDGGHDGRSHLRQGRATPMPPSPASSS